jgi:zinc transporter ZupT
LIIEYSFSFSFSSSFFSSFSFFFLFFFLKIGVGVGYFTLLFIEHLINSTGHGHSHGLPTEIPKREVVGRKKKKVVPINTDKKGPVDSCEEDSLSNEIEIELCDDNAVSLAPSFSIVVFLGLGIHSFVDGLIVSGAMKAANDIGLRVIVAIILHKFPDGFVLSSILVNQNEEGKSIQGKSILLIIIISSMTPLGIFSGYFIFRDVSVTFLGAVLGFGSGTFIYISTSGILPEILHSKKYVMATCVSVCCGYSSILVMEYLFHAH